MKSEEQKKRERDASYHDGCFRVHTSYSSPPMVKVWRSESSCRARHGNVQSGSVHTSAAEIELQPIRCRELESIRSREFLLIRRRETPVNS